MPNWRLEVLAGGRLREGDRSLLLERKTAAMLAYLALEGATPRSRLAGLLWPDSSEATARANLRQLLKRLRELTGAMLVAPGDPLGLAGELDCDAAGLQVAAFMGRHAEAAAMGGELLAGYDYDDCPDLDDWLLGRRERLAGLRQAALLAEAQRLERDGDYREALLRAEELVEADPVSEEAHRLVMRLSYLLGDRPAALRAYGRCKEILRRELGVEPLPETLALAREIDRGMISAPGGPRARSEIPLSVLRPPVLAGRERAWAQLEAAWEAGLAVFVAGEPGVGKTRLMLDFAASKGAIVRHEARPGDAGIPHASEARFARRLLELQPGMQLAPWLRRELSRLLPELVDEALPPLRSERDRLRLLEAGAEFTRLGLVGQAGVVVDDFHYCDAASVESIAYTLSRGLPATGAEAVRSLFGYRAGELSPEANTLVEGLVAAGLAVRLELEPLDLRGLGQLLGGLDLPGADRLAEPLLRYTGGNPLFVVETLKSLIESGGLAQGLQRQPPPGRVRSLLLQRLARLSPAASRLAQVAAVAEDHFDLELAAAVLDTSPLELAEALQELEAAHMMREFRFSHGLLFETVGRALASPVKALLHRRVLGVLAERGAPAALLAQHAEAGGLAGASFAYRLQAGDDAMRLFALHSAIEHYEQAHRLAIGAAQSGWPQGVEVAELRRLYYSLGIAYVYTNAFEAARALYAALLDFARRAGQPELEWLAQSHLAYLAVHDGYDLARAASFGQAALATAERTGRRRLLVEALQELAGLYTLALKPDAALPYAERALAVAREEGEPELVGRSLLELELAQWKLGQWAPALASLEEARGIYAERGLAALEARALHGAAFDRIAVGQARRGLADAREALRLSRQSDSQQEEVNAAGVAALAQLELGRYAEALELALASVTLSRELNVPVLLVMALRRLALVRLARFETGAAEETLLEAAAYNASLPRRPRIGELEALQCRLRLLQGRPEAALEHARAVRAARDFPWAEPWILRWPVVEALVRGGEVAAAEEILNGYRARDTSPRHRLVWLRMRASLERSRGLAEDAARSLEEAAGLARSMSLLGAQLELYGALAALRRRLGRPDEAGRWEAAASQAARALAACLEDGAARRAFLEAALQQVNA